MIKTQEFITSIAANNKVELDKQIRKLKMELELDNPQAQEVDVKVLKPNPNTVKFKNYEATSFMIKKILKFE